MLAEIDAARASHADRLLDFRPSALGPSSGARAPGTIRSSPYPYNPVYLLPLVEIVGGRLRPRRPSTAPAWFLTPSA